MRKPTPPSSGAPPDAQKIAVRILARLGRTQEDGGVFADDLEIIAEMVSTYKARIYHCNICGGRVDLTNATTPTIGFGKVNR